LDRNLNRLEAKATLLEQEKSRLSEDLNRQSETIQDLIGQKKSLETELQEKKNLVRQQNCILLESISRTKI
jgi:chromosome segregation ATPase